MLMSSMSYALHMASIFRCLFWHFSQCADSGFCRQPNVVHLHFYLLCHADLQIQHQPLGQVNSSL